MQNPIPNPPITAICTTNQGASSSMPVLIVATYKNGTE